MAPGRSRLCRSGRTGVRIDSLPQPDTRKPALGGHHALRWRDGWRLRRQRSRGFAARVEQGLESILSPSQIQENPRLAGTTHCGGGMAGACGASELAFGSVRTGARINPLPQPDTRKPALGGHHALRWRDGWRLRRQRSRGFAARVEQGLESILSPSQMQQSPREAGFVASGWGRGIRTPADGVRVRSPTTRRSPKGSYLVLRINAWSTGWPCGPCADRPSCARRRERLE